MTIPRPRMVVFLALLSLLAGTAASGQNPPLPDVTSVSPIRLFAGVEEAWAASDAERLAAFLDTTVVRIAIKPGTPLTSAQTRVAAAFLLQDQLRLVHTHAFQVTRFDCDKKRPICRAQAIWTGDWGGRQGKRAVRVTLVARSKANRWLLTEIRADD